MAVEGPEKGQGREATTAAMLTAAEELFSARGFTAVSVRDIAERAGVSHALVHRYLGSKAEIYRTVLTSNEEAILGAAPEESDPLVAAGLMFRAGLTSQRQYVRLIAHSALHGLSYERTSGRFAATERLVELAESAAASAPAAERAEKDLDPRFVVAGVVALLLGWVATAPWVLPACGIADMDEAEIQDGLERLVRGMLSGNVPGLGHDGPGSG